MRIHCRTIGAKSLPMVKPFWVLALFIAVSQAMPAFGQEEARASFVFVGVPIQLHAATTSVPASANTAIVTVGKIIRAPADLAKISGQNITVRVREPAKLEPGKTYTFFTNGWLSGESYGVLEVATLAGEISSNAPLVAATTAKDLDLAVHVSESDVIVSGTVTRFLAPAAADRRRMTEHDPQWQQAVVAVDNVAKGGVAANSTVIVRYPTSPDLLYKDFLKPKIGDRAIFILRKTDAVTPAGTRVFLAPDKADIRAPAERTKIRDIMAAMQPAARNPRMQ
ncbi:MAG: hypothetical protein JWN70_4947 [Planctomycetaceae bacterium]|nr:hypothetical protein [Planctomycetaceae bacterium]